LGNVIFIATKNSWPPASSLSSAAKSAQAQLARVAMESGAASG
jgi:hypothetical protein